MKKHTIIFLCVVVFMFAICAVVGFFFVRYPLRYNSFVKKYAATFNVPPSLVYSIINVESNFNKNAKSHVGAVGLMQLMPETSKEIAQKLGEEFSEEGLFNPETNIKFGCYYLGYLLNKFSGDITNAVASYNAGFNRVISWLNNPQYSNNGKLTNIPVLETKNYVKKVNINLCVYKTIVKS